MTRPNQFLSPEGDLEDYFVDEYWLIDQWVGDTLWTWGLNSTGQLGDNTLINRSTPLTTFAGGTNWKQVACGAAQTAAIKTDGTLWTWGSNAEGQLGNNTTSNRATPVTTFAGGNNWKQVSCTGHYTAAIKTDGTLWTWGLNFAGCLGDNTTISRSTPVTTFAGGTNWKQVSGGGYHTAAIKTDGTLWIWGRNSYGQLGINTEEFEILTPVTTFAGGSNWKQVSVSSIHTAAIKTDGTLWLWGNADSGQLGATFQRVTNGTISDGSSIFYTSNTAGILAGFVAVGSLSGLGTVVSVNSGVSITFSGTYTSSIAIVGEKDGPDLFIVSSGNSSSINSGDTVVSYSTSYGTQPDWTTVDYVDGEFIFFTPGSPTGGWGGTIYIAASGGGGGSFSGDLYVQNELLLNKSTPVTTFAGGTNWKQVSCSSNIFTNGISTAIKTDGTLWTWGYNFDSVLGTNDSSDRLTPVTTFAGGTNWKQVSVGNFHMAATKTDGTLWIWGYPVAGQLGDNRNSTIMKTPITTFAGGTNWKQVSCGRQHTAAVTSGTDPTFFIS